MDDQAESKGPAALVLHSSAWRLGIQWLTPSLLLAFGTWGLVTGARTTGPIVVLAIGLVTASVVLLDLPVRSEFTAEGVTRVCPLRRQHLPWTRVVAVERLGGLPSRRGDDGGRGPGVGRGLAARTGPRRVVLLVDRRESHAEYVALRDLLKGRATRLRAAEPPLEASPAGRGPRALHRRDRN